MTCHTTNGMKLLGPPHRVPLLASDSQLPLRDKKKTAGVGVDDVLFLFEEQAFVPEHLRAVFLVEPDLDAVQGLYVQVKIQDDRAIYSRFISYIIYLYVHMHNVCVYYIYILYIYIYERV